MYHGYRGIFPTLYQTSEYQTLTRPLPSLTRHLPGICAARISAFTSTQSNFSLHKWTLASTERPGREVETLP